MATKCCGRYVRELKARQLNLPAWLMVLYSTVSGCSIELSLGTLFSLVTYPEKPSCYSVLPESNTVANQVMSVLQNVALAVSYPVMGWLADVMIGRSKVLNSSLWSCWLGTALQVTSYCLQYGTCGLPANIAKYGISLAANILLTLGAAGIFSTLVPYGLDQLVGKSSAQIRNYLHWLIWGLFVGYQNGYIAFLPQTVYNANLVLATGIVTLAYTTLVLCVSLFFNSKFQYVGRLRQNPYTLIYNVLKYAKQHKWATNRSAFTYWEDKIPSRIDLGKSKYGGPFTESEVEDVKTFGQIMAILLINSSLYIPYYTVSFGVLRYMRRFEGVSKFVSGYGSFILWTGFENIIIVAIPMLELVILPLFPKMEYFLLKSLRGIGASYVLLFLSLISMLAIDTVGTVTANSTECAFYSTATEVVSFSFLYYCIPLFFFGLLVLTTFYFTFEFICSQSPTNMTGMLIGAYYFLRSVYLNIGGWLVNPFSQETIDTHIGPLSCTFWTLLMPIIMCVAGGMVFLAIMRWYQKRQRDDEFNLHKVTEETYEDMLIKNTSTNLQSGSEPHYSIQTVDNLNCKGYRSKNGIDN